VLVLAGMERDVSDALATQLDQPATIELPYAVLTRRDLLLGGALLTLSLLALASGQAV